jgi:hypothetical protein
LGLGFGLDLEFWGCRYDDATFISVWVLVRG